MTGTTITVGGLVSVVDFGTDLGQAAEARFAVANKDNELPCGRQIKLAEAADDGGTSTTNLAAIQRLIQQDHVFAIVPSLSAFIESGEQYINENKVPTIGWGVTPTYCATSNQSDMYLFGFNGCLSEGPPYTYASSVAGPGLIKLLQVEGKGGVQGKTAAVIGDSYAASIAGVDSIASQLEATGFKIVYAKNPTPAPPTVVTDFAPYVQALMTANGGKPPDVIASASGPANAFGLSKALQIAGYKGLFNSSNYAPQLAAAAKGTYANNTFATTESNTPAMANIVSTLHAAGITTIGQPELAAYLSADMFVQILKKVGPDLTPQRFQQVASSFTYTLTGVVGPSYYPAGFLAGPPCVEILYSDGTKWNVTVPYSCATTDLKKVNGKYVPVPYPSGIAP